MESQKNSKRHLTAHYSSILLFDKTAGGRLKGLEFAPCNPFGVENKEKAERDNANFEQAEDSSNPIPTVSDSMYCHCCQTEFADREEQLQHYKCDWHRYNLHLRLRGLPGISEDEFENIAGDVSSISGSDEESDGETENANADVAEFVPANVSIDVGKIPNERKFHKVFFRNETGELISLYRCLLHHKKKPITGSTELCEAANEVVRKQKWTVLMVSSGHFAGAVFNGEQILEHKTFHRYTVRAKRGSAQSSRDSQGNAPKSAGSSLRRYNEAALVQEVQELMATWLNHLKSSDFIFVHVPVANRAMFYAGKNPSLRKDDDRIRVIPFPTRRPTFNEVKRVHQMLASVECYGQEADVRDFVPLSPQRMYNKDSGKLEVCPEVQSVKSPKKSIKDAVKSESKQVKISDIPVVTDSTGSESPAEDLDLVGVMETINLADGLKEFDSSVNKKKRKKKGKKNQEKCDDSNSEQVMSEKERCIRNDIFTACKLGNSENLDKALKEILQLPHDTIDSTEMKVPNGASSESNDASQSTKQESTEAEDSGLNQSVSTRGEGQASESVVARILNSSINGSGDTFLHLASAEGRCDIMRVLMEHGSDPAIRNQGGKLPYNLGNGEVRNAFRRFMASQPNKFDYVKAQIPAPLTAEMEEQKRQKLAKKRAEKKKATQERNKVKKAAEKQVREEEELKARFLALSDREKRALAAEKRILQQHAEQGSSRPVLNRCWQCGTDITGKVPFEYSEFKFCTTQCLREHRGKGKR